MILINSYVFAPSGGTSTSYANTGGTGDRRSIITLTRTLSAGGDTARWLDGSTTDTNAWFGTHANVSGLWLKFDFGASYSPIIDEVKFYQQNSSTQGTWQFQGSADDSSWTDIGSPFALGGVATQTITAMSGNTTGYRYYRFLGVSGSSTDSPYVHEFEFKLV